MKVVGLCGGSGSGKGIVCSIFNELGVPSIDTDMIYHGMISTYSDCTKELIAEFGKEIYDGTCVDRKKLRDIVFNSPEKLNILNKITHSHILKSVRFEIERLRKNGAVGVIVDAPLLFESNFDKDCDSTVCVIADESVRIARVIQRDGISIDVATSRIRSQKSNDELIECCTFSIINNGTKEELYESVLQLNKLLFS